MMFQKSESRRSHFTTTSSSLRGILGTICIIYFMSPLHTFAVPISIKKGEALGDGNSSALVVYKSAPPPPPPNSVCRYRAASYLTGDEVPTDEPCLRCQCKKQAVVCKLRICTEPVPDAPPPGCVVVQKAKSCCPKLVCPETRKIIREREQRLSTGNHKNETILTGISSLPPLGVCNHEGTIYAEGSAMRSSTPCDNCFCIRGEIKCSRPQCVIPLDGCKPRYRSFACCPTNYDCSESNSSAIIQSASAIPQFLKGCRLNRRFIYEGEPILPIHLEPNVKAEHICQSCFCLGGVVRCRPLECSRPIAGCEPVTEDGHCCPSRYSCQNKTLEMVEELEKVGANLLSPEQGREDLQEAISVQATPTPNSEFDDPQKNGSGNVNPKDEEMNLTSPLSPDGSSEFLSNKLKSDIGSREERRNKDKEEMMGSKTSYEDDEKDYNFGVPSLESVDHELIAKMTFMDSGGGDESAAGKVILKSIGKGEKESSEFGLATVEEGRRGNENEIMETTTPFQEQPGPGFSFVKLVQVALPPSLPPALQNENMTRLEEIRNSTTQTSNGGGIHHSPNFEGKSNISFSLLPDRPRTDVLTSPDLPVVLSPPAPPGPTVANLEFIPFGVEDARLLPPIANNGTEVASPDPLFPPYFPIKITYDRELVQSDLIPPTPPKGYYSPAPKVSSSLPGDSAGGVIPGAAVALKPPPDSIDKFRNVIMDVPVSTSLYNNGFYRGGIITTPEVIANSSFPGQVFDDSGEHLLPIFNEGKDLLESFPISIGGRVSGPSDQGAKIQNPSRTYSKFGILDSPSYRHETGNENPKFNDGEDGNLAKNPFQQPDGSSRGDYDDDPSNPLYKEDEGTFESFEEKELPGSNEFSIPISPGHNETQKPIIISITSISTSKENNHEPTTTITPLLLPPRNFKPIVAFPFRIPQKPREAVGTGSLGLKLSGCNIYGKMYKIGNVIRELSGPCVQCQCSEIGVQCSEIPC